jgi:hypothetical protein
MTGPRRELGCCATERKEEKISLAYVYINHKYFQGHFYFQALKIGVIPTK